MGHLDRPGGGEDGREEGEGSVVGKEKWDGGEEKGGTAI